MAVFDLWLIVVFWWQNGLPPTGKIYLVNANTSWSGFPGVGRGLKKSVPRVWSNNKNISKKVVLFLCIYKRLCIFVVSDNESINRLKTKT